MDTKSLKSRLVSGLAWLAAMKAVSQAVTWMVTLVVVRLLSPEDYGLMGMAVLFTGFLLLFHELGLGAAIVQRADLTIERVSEVRWALLAVNTGLCVLLMLAAPLIAGYFGEPRLTAIIQVLSVIFVLAAIGVPSACLLQREMAFKTKSQSELFGNISGSFATLTSALLGFGVWSLVIGYVTQQTVTHTLYCIHRPVPFARRFSLEHVKPLMNFGAQVASSKVLWYFSSNADFLVVGRLLGAQQLGYYSLAFQFASLPIDKVVSLVTQVALPSFAALQNESERLGRYYLRFVGYVALVTFPMFLGLFLLAGEGVAVFLTEKWAPVVLPLQMLCLVSCLRAIETMNTPLLLAKGRPGVCLFNNILQAIGLPVAFVIGARWGLYGVAMAWLAAWPVLFAVVTGQTIQIAGVSVASYLGALRHPVLGGIAMVAAVTVLRPLADAALPPLAVLLLLGTAAAATYVAYQAMFNGAAMRDLMAMVKRPRVGAAGAVSVQST